MRSITYFRDECEKLIRKSDAGEPDIKIFIENSEGYAEFQIGALDILLKNPCFALTFDSGHNYMVGGIDEPFIFRHTDKLCHFHINDAVQNKNHLAIVSG